jgi:DUF438 domain-containing protein
MANSKNKRDSQKGILARVGDLITGEDEKGNGAEKATTMLKEDHDRVRELFKKYEKLGDRASAEKQHIASEVSRELTIHSELEEKIFYPACLKGKKDAEKMVRESIEEHRIVKTLIGEIGRLSPSDEQFEAKFTVLRENVEHHADEEEDDLFPEAEDLLSDEGLRRLGAQMKDLKEELQDQTRPETSRGAKSTVTSRRPAKKTQSRRSPRSYA